MCFQDIVIARNTIATPIKVNVVSGSFNLLLGQNANRYAFYVMNGGPRTYLSLYPTPTSGQEVITLAALSQGIGFSLKDYGKMVTLPWYASADSANSLVVVEVVLNDEVLSTLTDLEKRVWQQIMGH